MALIWFSLSDTEEKNEEQKSKKTQKGKANK